MTELVLPVAVLVAALTMTCFFCLRPMRAGQACHHSTPPAEHYLDRALSQARQELERLRATPTAGQTVVGGRRRGGSGWRLFRERG